MIFARSCPLIFELSAETSSTWTANSTFAFAGNLVLARYGNPAPIVSGLTYTLSQLGWSGRGAYRLELSATSASASPGAGFVTVLADPDGPGPAQPAGDAVKSTAWDAVISLNGEIPNADGEFPDTVVGKKMDIEATVTPAALQGQATFQWSIAGGKPIADYALAQDIKIDLNEHGEAEARVFDKSATVFNLEKNKYGVNLLKERIFTYYYTTGGGSVPGVLVKIGESKCTRTTALDVLRPTVDSFAVTKTSDTPETRVYYDDELSWVVSLGETSPGITWNAQVTSPLGTGKIGIVQLVRTDTVGRLREGLNPNPNLALRRSTGEDYVLDNTYPYGGWVSTKQNIAATISDHDSPCVALSLFSHVHIADYFKTYLVFQPDGGIPVTLAMHEWSWRAEVSLLPSGSWYINPDMTMVSVGAPRQSSELPEYAMNFIEFPFVAE